jgi:hypothetical protein
VAAEAAFQETRLLEAAHDKLRLSRFMPLSPLVPWGTEVYSTFTVILDSLDSAGTSR